MSNKLKNILKTAFYVYAILFTLWFVLSYVSVISQNTLPNPQYSDFNFFSFMFRLRGI